MRLPILLAAASLCVFAAETVDLNAVHLIREEAFNNSKVMDHAFSLTDVYGPRLTGSPGLKASAEWVIKTFNEWGLAGAHLESWPFGRGWSSVKFAAHLKEPSYMPLIGVPLPWSPGTEGPVSGEAILAPIATEADMGRWKGKLKGKMVLVSPVRELTPPMGLLTKIYSEAELANEALALAPSANAYAGQMGQPPRPGGPAEGGRPPMNVEQMREFRRKLNKYFVDEGVAVVINSSFRGDGGTVFAAPAGSRDEKDPVPPPSVTLAPEHYNRIVRLLDKKTPVTFEFDIQNKFHTDDKNSFNVIAEIPGTDKKDEIVMVGGHIDSWTFGTGATDNAAGTAVAMEVMRIIKATGLQPRRTIRIGLWSGEEQGLLGSREYVKAHFADRETMELKPEHSKLAAYFNLDNGTGKIRGIYLQKNDMARPIFEKWLEPFKDMAASTITIRNTGGTDHLAFDAVGLPGFQFIQDPVDYATRTHHSNMDVYDRLQRSDLMQASAIMASFAYNASVRDEMIPRKPLPKPQPVTGKREDLEYRKIGDISLKMDAYIPPAGDGPFPAVIIVHGGGWINGTKTSYVTPMFEPLTKSGLAWFSIDYRLAPEHKYPAALEDVEAAVAYIRKEAKRFKVDPNRIALVGESAGGHLVALAGARGIAKVQAVVDFYGLHDVIKREKERGNVGENIQKFLGVSDFSDASLKKMREASPVTYVKKGIPPFLFIHGTKDAAVPYDQSPLMCDKIKAAGGSCEVFTVEDAPHGVGPWEKNPDWQKYKEKMVDWLKATLK